MTVNNDSLWNCCNCKNAAVSTKNIRAY